jgi:hypothetical protein
MTAIASVALRIVSNRFICRIPSPCYGPCRRTKALLKRDVVVLGGSGMVSGAIENASDLFYAPIDFKASQR